jgi:threonine dehydratase
VLQRPNDLARAALEAYSRIQPYVRRTPVQSSKWLAASGGAAEVLLKLESEQATNSFKARGALNKVCLLTCCKQQTSVLARKPLQTQIPRTRRS